jgi:hypothetical protein
MTNYSSKKSGETVRVKFELRRIVSQIESATITVHLREGKFDANLASMLVPASTFVTGTQVEALIRAGVPGNSYTIRCTAVDGTGQILIEEALLPVS